MMQTIISELEKGNLPVWAIFVVVLVTAIKWWLEVRKSSVIEGQKLEALRALEREKTAAAQEQLIHKTQFEEEFKIYRELWSALADLADATYALRPVWDTRDPKKSPDDIKVERVEKFVPAYESFRKMVNKNRPFYAPEVHQAVVAVRNLCSKEVDYYQRINPGDVKDYWENAMQNQEELRQLIDAACDAVRQRFWSVNVQD